MKKNKPKPNKKIEYQDKTNEIIGEDFEYEETIK
jgi:hypothetical protein